MGHRVILQSLSSPKLYLLFPQTFLLFSMSSLCFCISWRAHTRCAFSSNSSSFFSSIAGALCRSDRDSAMDAGFT